MLQFKNIIVSSQNYKSHQDGENNDPKIRSRCTLQWNKTYEISVLSKFGI